MCGSVAENSPCAADDAQSARYFFLPKSLWRSGLYGVVACFTLPLVVLAAAEAPNGPAGAEPVVAAIVFIAAGAFLAQFLFARLKVDQHGISRRMLWWWDLWPWEVFADGSVQDAGCFRYSLPARPFWRRKLTLAIDDPHAVNDLILRVWKRPPPDPISEIVSFRVQDSFRLSRKVELKPSGIPMVRRRIAGECSWADVVRVTIWRAARYRRDFAEIEIELPDTKLMLFDRGDVQNWKGATAEQIAGILQRHVPASRLGDFSLAGRPISVAEADARFARERQRLESAQKPFQHMTWLFWLVKIATFVFIGAGFGVMIALYALMFYGMAWFIRREARQTQARYEQERAELLDANRDDHDDQSLTGDELEAGIEVGT